MLQVCGPLTLFGFILSQSQRARFKAVELLGRSNARTVVVATDVAARGLDIPSVASVVHYDAARSVDSFVHRSGRTAVSFLSDERCCAV
jgi:superfamily II DNA/RNA helicase